MKYALVFACVVVITGCGGAVRQNAIETASADHGCPQSQTRVINARFCDGNDGFCDGLLADEVAVVGGFA